MAHRFTIAIRDEGEAPRPAKLYDRDIRKNGEIVHKKGELILNEETGLPEDLGSDGRNAWPKDTWVAVKPRMKPEDMEMINKINDRSNVVRGEVSADHLDLYNPHEVQVAAIPYFAVMVKGLHCPIKTREQCTTREDFEDANFFEDPDTCKLYEENGTDADGEPFYKGDPIPGTGKIIEWPDDIMDRMNVTRKKIDLAVVLYVVGEINRRVNDPLPGTRAVA